VGFLTIGVVGLILGKLIHSLHDMFASSGSTPGWAEFLLVDSTGELSGWRLLMLFGALPALLTFFIRLVVPESERWTAERDKGAISNWKTRDMLAVLVGAIGPLFIIYLWAADMSGILQRAGFAAPGQTAMLVRVVGSILGLVIALIGYTYPVIRFLNRTDVSEGRHHTAWRSTIGRMLLGACLSGVALIGTWASLQQAPSWADQLVEKNMKMEGAEKQAITAARSQARSYTQIVSAIGAIVGTIGGALIGDRIGRRITYTALCLGSLFSSLAFFQLNHSYGVSFLISVFFAGGLTASFYGWLPLYLPELFRTSVRATGQGFSFNFGRILAAIAALQTGYLMQEVFKGNYPYACSIMSAVYLVGVVIIWFAPETRGQPLPK
jgi:MFS family permease